ncbi:MAG: NADH-quinone oxidoreductase subunit J [Chloroflexota bacterium]|nr:NADH-quinone oxidoreductase subunit J [Chloroflexota bacterium]
MLPLTLFFLLFAAVALFGAVMVLVSRNPVHSVLFMLLTFANVAGMFLLLNAEFIAAVQLLVYSGAILVLFLFVVMLLQRGERPLPALTQPLQAPVAIFVGLALLSELALVVLTSNVGGGTRGADTPEAIARAGGNIQALGSQLYTTWLLPFEIASVLLLVAAVGAIYLAKEDI